MPSNKKKNADDDKSKEGQKKLSSFFTAKKKKKVEVIGIADNGKENDMGLSSNLRKPAIQKQKEAARNNKKKKKITQTTIGGGMAEGRCDEGTKVCKACEKLKSNPNFKSFAHHPTCTKNANYRLTDGGRISMEQYYLNKADEERLKRLNKPLSEKELCTSIMTRDDVDTFFAPRTTDTADDDSVDLVDVGGERKMNANDSAGVIYSHYETKKLIDRVNHYMKNPTSAMRRGKTVPLIIAAGIQALLDLVPIHFKKGTNQVMANDKKSITYKKLQAYKKQFPPGTIGFTFPRADKSKSPHHYYSQLEDRTIYLVCWELNIPGWQPTCFRCSDTMIHDTYDFQSHGYATPIFDITGRTDYACSMYYNCKKCDNRCKANDGRILFSLDPHYRNAYPVDPRYAVNKETHIARSFSKVMDKMFVTHGNGDQLSLMLNELRGDHYLEREEEYYCQAIATGTKIAASLPTFEYSIGRYSPTGCDLRDMKDAAADSTLLSTGISDKDRYRRELQSVGCSLTSASDHTFEFRKNYIAGLLPENACGHTIGSDTGEIASIAIVKDTSQKEYAHQAEQCTLRPNWKPKVHTTDNCPSGIGLWKRLVTGVHCQLGLFHFMYRITKTLNKECTLMKASISSLQTCLYYYEAGDLENVKRCLRDGLLGVGKGGRCPEEQIDSKARTYRENVRVWTYDGATIRDRLMGWLHEYKDESDDKGEQLFTMDTTKTVAEQMNKVDYIVDYLSKDELYLTVQPSLRSTTGLKTYIGARGTESKLEKGHHSIAHFANGGMRHTLADFLGMGGLALYNLRIRYRLKLAKMTAVQRSKIPVGFHKSSHFTNHLQLSHNNKLAMKAGLNVECHKEVEILQPDNNERFFYEYYLQEEQRQTDGIEKDDGNRCLCRDCGRSNPYRKRKQQWEDQTDVRLPTSPTQLPPPPPPPPSPPPPPPPPLQLLPAPQIVTPPPTIMPTAAATMPPQQQQEQPPPPQQLQSQQEYQYVPPPNIFPLPYSAIVATTAKPKRRRRKKKKTD